jgi:hypothetical protein
MAANGSFEKIQVDAGARIGGHLDDTQPHGLERLKHAKVGRALHSDHVAGFGHGA